MRAIRRGDERGHANHGWLDSWHSFSFADYYDPEHVEFGALRVINEDRVAAGAGFGTHGHRDMEILSYVLDGELAHKDSTGTSSVIRPGDVQRMSAGRGVMHSEFNHSATKPVHFLQIWIQPDVRGIAPEYEEKHFGPEQKRGRLRLIASRDGADGSVRIHHVHVARGSVVVDGERLEAGDALAATDITALEVAQGRDAEVLVFDLAAPAH
jgi:redox-sensitive bicupin YhaK (pirin superfamily)